MRNAGGYYICTDPLAPTKERDTFTCKHCNKVVFVTPRASPEDMGGRCTCCDGLICPACVGKGCDPLEKKLEREEAQYHARRSYGL